MSNPSNLYAEKVFAEHPIALWALDDKVDYVSLINDTIRDVSTWDIVGGQAVEITNDSFSEEPFTSSPITKILGNASLTTATGQVVCSSPNGVASSSLNTTLETFSISTYIYSDTAAIIAARVGYEYTDPDTLETVQKLKLFKTSIDKKWTLISETFEIPSADIEIRPCIRIDYKNLGSPDPEDYKFFINGLTFGQWSEEFTADSLGVSPVNLPTELQFLNMDSAIEAKQYGLPNSPGYYLVKDNKLTVQNNGVPMVFGATNLTKIVPSQSSYTDENLMSPSMIIPGNGFLNESGRYREYTIEMWLRVDARASIPRRIFGPVGSKDGLYVDGPFLALQIGNYSGSYFVGEWYRPMLIDIKIMNDSATLLVNGEEAISIKTSTKSLVLPQPQDSVNDYDWLGFYAYNDVPVVEIDCVGIYTYQVPSIVAKRRFVYGQAVDLPEMTNSAYNGTSVSIDYSFANYTNNYSYPDVGSWNQGIVENLNTDNNIISTPEYNLPELVLEDKTISYSDWLASSMQQTPEFYSVPSISFKDYSGYLFFENIPLINKNARSLYGIFKAQPGITEDQILFKIFNQSSGKSLIAMLTYADSGYSVKYSISNGSSEEVLYLESIPTIMNSFFAGIDIKQMSLAFGKEISSFFNNSSKLSVFVCGDETSQNNFSGSLIRFGFDTNKNFLKVSDIFPNPLDEAYPEVYDAGNQYFGNDTGFWSQVADGGRPDSFSNADFTGHIASYTLIPQILNDSLILDIGVSSSWQDYIPLSYFAKYVSSASGKKYYDLDFVQINIGYPKSEKLISGTQIIDTSDALVRTYITFQYLKSGANNSSENYAYYAPANHNNTITMGNDWMTTKYEVVDGTVIYPPVGVNFNDLAIVTHIEISTSRSISRAVKVKSLQYASQSLNEISSNAIGTKFGTPIFPYKKYGSYFDYKSKNPFRIYKGITPYLYLTKNSGMEVVGEFDSLVARGLIIPVNSNSASNYKIVALQSFIRYNKHSFSQDPIEIFEIESKDTYIKFYLVANDASGKRAKIYAVNAKSGSIENGVLFYINGSVVREPVISTNEWSAIGISFSKPIDFSNYVGGIRINGPILFNNLSFYQSTNLQEVQTQAFRQWYSVMTNNLDQDVAWKYWDDDYVWNEVLVKSTVEKRGVNPSDVYKSYTGTNKYIIDDTRPLRLNGYEYRLHKDVLWQTSTIKPV